MRYLRVGAVSNLREIHPETKTGFSLREIRHRLLLIDWPRNPSDEDVAAYVTRGLSYFKEGTYAALHSAPAVGFLSAVGRNRISKFARDNRPVFEKNCVASGLASHSIIVRGYFTAVGWFAEPEAYSMRAFRELDEASAWCAEHLDLRGVAPGL